MKRQLIVLFTILLALVLPNSDVEGQVARYSITDIGLGIAYDINNNGQVVGQYSDFNIHKTLCFFLLG